MSALALIALWSALEAVAVYRIGYACGYRNGRHAGVAAAAALAYPEPAQICAGGAGCAGEQRDRP